MTVPKSCPWFRPLFIGCADPSISLPARATESVLTLHRNPTQLGHTKDPMAPTTRTTIIRSLVRESPRTQCDHYEQNRQCSLPSWKSLARAVSDYSRALFIYCQLCARHCFMGFTRPTTFVTTTLCCFICFTEKEMKVTGVTKGQKQWCRMNRSL